MFISSLPFFTFISQKKENGDEIYFNSNAVAIFARNMTQSLKTKSDIPETYLPSDLSSGKIQDGGGHHVEIRHSGYNLVTVAYICTKFCTET